MGGRFMLEEWKDHGWNPAAERQALTTILRLWQNIANSPSDSKFRTIRRDNAAIRDKVLKINHAEKLLMVSGWETNGDDELILPDAIGQERADEVVRQLNKVLEEITAGSQ